MDDGRWTMGHSGQLELPDVILMSFYSISQGIPPTVEGFPNCVGLLFSIIMLDLISRGGG